MTFLASILSGIWGYVVAFWFGIALASASTYEIVHNANAVEIGSLKLAAKTKEAADVSTSLNTLQRFISNMQNADTGYNDTLRTIAAEYKAISAGLKDATKKPLPPDCRPDVGRMHSLSRAVAATHQTPGPGP